MTRLAQHPLTLTPRPVPASAPGDTRRFLSEILHHPHQLGAISPTGAYLARQAAALIATHAGPQVVVELGPGGGAITDTLHAQLPPGSTLIAVEINDVLVAHLRRTRPWLHVVHGDAAHLPDLLPAANRQVDLIISALPWSLIGDDAQQDILAGIGATLAPHGTFATVVTAPTAPLPGIRRMRRHLQMLFATVTRTRTVWRNVPPAHLLVARHPHRPPDDVVGATTSTCDDPTWANAA